MTLCFLLWAGLAAADPIDADEAVRRALAASPWLAVSDAAAEVARGERIAARAIEPVSLRLRGSRFDDEDGLPPRADLDARIPIPRPHLMVAAVDEAKAHGLEAEADKLIRAALIAGEVRALVASLGTADALLAALDREAEAREALVRLSAGRLSAGLASPLELARAESQRAEVEIERAQVRATLEGDRARLRRHLGAPAGAALEIVPAGDPLPVPTLDDAVAQALAHRGELSGARARVAEADAILRGARVEAIPWIDWVQVGTEWRPQVPDPLMPDAKNPPGLDLRMALDVPLSFGIGAIRAARAAATLSRAEVDGIAQDVALEVQEAWADAEGARNVWLAARAATASAPLKLPPDADPVEVAALAITHASAGVRAELARRDALLARAALDGAIGR